jgi:hypothetical protein
VTCKEFVFKKDYRLEWMYENEKISEKEKPEGRCIQCWRLIETNTDELNEIITKQDHKLLTDKLN